MKLLSFMKNVIPYFGAAALFIAVSCTACQTETFPLFQPGSSQKEEPQGPSEPSEPSDPSGDTKEFDWSALTASAHPRIIFTDEDFEAIKAALSKDQILLALHEKVLSIANSSVGKADLAHILTGKRMLSVSRDAEKRILACAYAYKTTGEQKYLTQAEHDIVTVCNFTDWNARLHFLDVGEMAAGVSLGYDWLYSELSEDTKTLVRKALNDFAFYPAQNKIWNLDFYNSESNWNQVCNGGLVCAALAVYENNQTVAKAIIEKAVESNAVAQKSMYSPDGNYPEGYSYWNYGTLYQALINTALETSGGSDMGLSKVDGFSKTGKYMLFMEGPLKKTFNYSDCAPSVVPCLAQWYFAWKFNNMSLLYIEKDRLSSYVTSSDSRMLPLLVYYAYKMSLGSFGEIPAPEENFFKGEGLTPVVLIHENWKMDQTDKFLGIKGGKGNTSHAHLDAGSFVYDADGVRWSADLGLQSYATLEPYINLWDMKNGSERWGSFRYNNFNHSTITVNDAYHRVEGVATFEGLVNTDGRKGAVVNISAPLAGEVESAKRTIYMEGDDLVIKDEIKALTEKSAKVRWTMVSLAAPTIEYGAITLKSATGKYRYLKTSSSTGHKPVLKTWSTVSNNSYDASNSGYYECGYEVTVAAGASAVITVRLTPEE